MASLRVSPGKVPSSYRNTLAIVPSPVSSFSENDPFSSYYHPSSLPKSSPMAPAPALPVKSDRRISRLIIPTIHASVPPAAIVTTSTTMPHDVYLSSEEDASSTPGDVSDYNWDSDSEEICSPPATTMPVTARMISVVYSGKPSMVQLSSRRSPSPRVCIRQDSASSISSSPMHYTNSSVLSLPSTGSETCGARSPSVPSSSSSSSSTRPISMFVNARPTSEFLPSSRTLPRTRPSFLSIDPYATSAPPSAFSADLTVSPVMQQDLSSPFMPAASASLVSLASSTATTASPSCSSATTTATVESSPAPKTPSAMFKRTIDLVRKKSRPTLNAALVSSVRDSTIPETPQLPQTPQLQVQHEFSTPSTPNTLPITNNDMLRVAKRNVSSPHTASVSSTASGSASPQPVLSSAVKTRILSLARLRNSVRA
ncbi:hypothetical protein CFO_g3538 [Ceratocystis platani]|uniref:Uncharacterized protein n=1 Tax=Ceratocystis fimbriata f. sp. platani TaxID=88771 RepID=A0A0F8B2L6_CERFI|nr:hypothetical protein CFO_g3538 [Ceratocystis platani]